MTLTANKTRVLITDDHAIVRKGIRALLAETDDIQVVGEASNGVEAVSQAKELNPDIVLMDLLMPEMDGIEATRQITAQMPEVHVLVLTSFVGDAKIYPAIKAGALGYVMKDAEPAELIRAIQAVRQGQPSLPPTIARKIMKEIREAPSSHTSREALTSREVAVLQLLARGLTNEEIAGELAISEATVRTHVSHLLAKLHMANRVQATLYALQTGISYIEDPKA